MRRREFIVLLGGAAAWPLAALAQQQAAPLIGFLSSRSPEESAGHTAAFLEGLKAFGYIDGRTATIEYRWAKGAYDLLPALANQLAGLHPAIIMAGAEYNYLSSQVWNGSPDSDATVSGSGRIPLWGIVPLFGRGILPLSGGSAMPPGSG